MPPAREILERLLQRALDRVRNEPNLDWLVEQGLQLGHSTHIGHPLFIDRLHPWLITIGDHSTLSPYVAVITHDASLVHHTGHVRLGAVVVGNRVSVGVGAVLLPGTIIGDDSVVGAGAVVHGEVPPSSLVTGNPAKISPLRPIVAWHRASARRSPTWPVAGWSLGTINEERKRAQREALAGGRSGYVASRFAPGGPYALSRRASS